MQQHTLEAERSPFPPFYTPEDVGIEFPATVGDFQRLTFSAAQALSTFYDLARHDDLARHTGLRV
jgi:hypothetical protein